MVITDYGRQAITWRLGSSLPDLYLGHVGIGNGSAVARKTDSTLTNEVNRAPITGSPDYTESYFVKLQSNFNATQMSGTVLTEISLFDKASGTGFTGSCWQRENFAGVEFDGTNELQTLNVIEVLASGVS